MMMILLLIVLVLLIVSSDSYRCYNYRNQITNKSYRKISSSLLILNDSKRKIIGRDNLGEPIYEDDINTSEGISVLGNIYIISS